MPRRSDDARARRSGGRCEGAAARAALGLLALLALLGCEHGVRLLGPYDGGGSPWPDGIDPPDADVLDADARRDDAHEPDGDLDGEPAFDGRFERPDGFCPLPGDPEFTFTENGAHVLPTAAGPAYLARLRPRLSWGTIGGGCDNPIFDLELDDSCRPDAIADCAFTSPEVQVYDLTGPTWTSPRDLPVSAAAPVGTRYAWRLRGCCPGNCCTEWNRPRYLEVGRLPNDLDGDGYGDLLVGAPRADASGAAPGKVYVFLGGPSPDERADYELRGMREGDGFGRTVAWTRDVDADGFADLAVSAPGDRSLQLFRGSRDRGPEFVVEHRLRGARRLGAGPAAAGDFEADGFADTAYTMQPGTFDSGGLVVLRGGTAPWAAVWPVYEALGGAGDGRTVTGVGDHRGRGFATVAVGDPPSDPTCPRGAVMLYDGSADLSDVEWNGFDAGGDWTECRGEFGRAVAAPGDVNEDGFDDILVGDGDYPYPDPTAQALVYFGPLPPGWPGIAEPTVLGRATERDTGFAEALAGAGDVNRDGHVDLLVGAPREGGFGRVHLYLGAGTTAGFEELILEAPVGAPAGFGAAVAGARDVNGDGYDDVLVGAPGAGDEVGAAYLYLGGAPPATTPALVLRGRDPGDRFGAAVD